MEINFESLDVLLSKGRELKQLLSETPEILTYLQLINGMNKEKLSLPKVDDVLIRSGEAAKILGVNQTTIRKLVKTRKLRGYIVEGSSHLKFWRSEVKALAKPVEKHK